MRDIILRWLTKPVMSNIDMLVILVALLLFGSVHVVVILLGVFAIVALFALVQREFWAPPITTEDAQRILQELKKRGDN